MIQMHHVVALVVVVIIVLLVFSIYGNDDQRAEKQNEHFDTHYNHSMGAQSIYARDNPEITLEEAERDARYKWSQRDLWGRNVYDKFYENKMRSEFDMPENFNRDYHDDIDGSYDLRFEARRPHKYSQKNMREPQLRSTFRGEIITLTQKQQW